MDNNSAPRSIRTDTMFISDDKHPIIEMTAGSAMLSLPTFAGRVLVLIDLIIA